VEVSNLLTQMLRQVAVVEKALIYEIMTRKSACNGA